MHLENRGSFCRWDAAPRSALLLAAFQLQKQAKMWIEMNIGVKLEAFQPE